MKLSSQSLCIWGCLMAAANLAAAQEYINVALDKPTLQSETKHGGVSSRAVDGNTDSNWGGGSITHTPENGANPWWEVDLEGSYEISKINIFGRTDCCSDRLRGMTVTIFNEEEEEVWSYSHSNQTPPNKLVLPVTDSDTDTDFVIGSKVRVSLTPRGTLSLAEVEVLQLFTPSNVPSISPSTSQSPTSSCPHTFVVSSEECTSNAFENAAPGTCQLSDISERYGLESTQMNELIEAYCEDAEPGLNFTYVTTESGNPRNFQWDNNYFDGSTLWNAEDTLNEDGDSINRTWEIHQQTRIAWPNLEGSYEDDNFQNCNARAVMCCFTDNHKVELSTNAEVCYHDMEDSATSNHIKAGWTLFDSETEAAYCTAFSWHDDEEHMSARYRGNALFYTSMYSLYEGGMAGNIPSAPMCACIEQMPVVTKPDCVSVVATDESYELSFTPDAISVRLAASVTYGDCGDFISHYGTMATAEEVTDLQNKIVEECDEPRREYLNDKFLVRGTTGEEYPVDTNIWDIVVGKGKYYSPAKGETFLRDGVENSVNKILYRYCLDCTGTHRHIFYKRLTVIPSELQFLDLFMDNWFDTHNVLGVDFNLFSTYEDAADDVNPWTFCNYNDSQVGFPRDCGPTGKRDYQWNRFYNGGGQNNVAYYVEKGGVDGVLEVTSSPVASATQSPITATSPPTISLTSSPTSSPTPSPTSAASVPPITTFSVRCGRKNSCAEENDDYSLDAVLKVRCCAETKLSDDFKQKQTCSVWATSKINGSCPTSQNHPAAVEMCSSISARLCTAEELELNCSVQTGCGGDVALIWTSTPGDGALIS